jgi:ADP-ribose pyrophosphatase YjhB (NUDIX family)
MGSKNPKPRIRFTAQAILVRGSEILVYEGRDRFSNRNFYRPVGGGVDFQERAADAALREFYEETGLKVIDPKFIGLIENIFTYNGEDCHEIVQLIHCRFKNKSVYERESFALIEGKRSLGQAVWKELKWLNRKSVRFYPQNIGPILLQFFKVQ